MLELPKVASPGIYCFRNKINGKCYVGSSKNIFSRTWRHRSALRNKNHYNPKFQHGWNKYGEENFECFVLQLCGAELLIPLEQKYIVEKKAVDEGYNIQPVAATNDRWTTSPEGRARISASRRNTKASPLARARMRAAKLGKKASLETKQKMSKAHLGIKIGPYKNKRTNYGPLSAEQKRQISETLKGRNLPLAVRQKQSAALAGKPKSKEHRENMRLAQVKRREREATLVSNFANPLIPLNSL